MIYFFRGKAATGKTTLADILSSDINVPVLRKDDVFDILSTYLDNDTNNKATYDLMPKIIQTSVDNNSDLIVDIGLCSTSSWTTFLSKMNLGSNKIVFLCDCSDNEIWKNRFISRLNNPKPNQYFKSINEVVEYYKKCDIELLSGEILIDSVLSIESLLKQIKSNIKTKNL